jgi:hypothetical protein
MIADLGDPFSLGGPVVEGQQRLCIPIIGGTFKGPKLSGKLVLAAFMWLPSNTRLGSTAPPSHYDDVMYICDAHIPRR